LVGTYRTPTIDYDDVPEGIIYRPPSARPRSTAPSALTPGGAQPAE
jgi:hypothetical protein